MITIDYRDRRPLYQQIVAKVEAMAVQGLLPPDSQLPSVRSLAMDLAINPNTIQRAYQELEKKGIIYSVQGKGSFIAQPSQEFLEQKKESFWQKVQETVHAACVLGIREPEFLQQCSRYFHVEEEGSHDRG